MRPEPSLFLLCIPCFHNFPSAFNQLHCRTTYNSHHKYGCVRMRNIFFTPRCVSSDKMINEFCNFLLGYGLEGNWNASDQSGKWKIIFRKNGKKNYKQKIHTGVKQRNEATLLFFHRGSSRTSKRPTIADANQSLVASIYLRANK